MVLHLLPLLRQVGQSRACIPASHMKACSHLLGTMSISQSQTYIVLGGDLTVSLLCIGNGRQKGEKAQEEESQPAEAGMGLTYKAMAIIAEDAPVPVSFEEHKD